MSYVVKIERDPDWDYVNVLTVEIDGKVVVDECDGGEPEDQSFTRDWKWVKPALEQAYQQGLKDGKKAEEEALAKVIADYVWKENTNQPCGERGDGI